VFKRRYSQQLSTDLAMMRRVELIVAERQANHKPSTDKEDSSPGFERVDTVRETDNEDSAPIDKDSTLKENSPYLLDPENSRSVQSGGIGELVAKGDERGDAKGDERGDAKGDD
jgi:hypothetical protein